MSSRFIQSLTVALASILLSCSSRPGFREPVTVEPNPNPAVPLAAVVKFSADRPVTTSINVTDGEHSWTLDYDGSHDPSKGLPVVGMRPDHNHEIRVTVTDAEGGTAEAGPFEHATPPLPEVGDDFPPIHVVVSKPEKMEPGLTLFNPQRRRVGVVPNPADRLGMLMALDNSGQVAWFYRTTEAGINDFGLTRSGTILFASGLNRLVEIDWLGNVVNQWYAKNWPRPGSREGIGVDAVAFHHAVDELPNGNIITLSIEQREVDNYYTSDNNPNAPRKRRKVIGDVIIEFERDTGKIVWEWHAFDHLDPYRIGYESLSPFWARRGFADTVDWSHANNLLYDQSDDSIAVNFRVQGAFMKIDRASKQIKWILSEPSGWGDLSEKLLKADGEVRWPYHQHSPTPTPAGTLLVFDNGNYQARPFDRPLPPKDTYSRAVEYKIDEKNMTVRELWSSETMAPDRVVSMAMGDVEWLPRTKNVLVGYGALVVPEALETVTWDAQSRLNANQWTRIREYARNPDEIVFEVDLKTDRPDLGWTLFGVERIDRVGPGGDLR